MNMGMNLRLYPIEEEQFRHGRAFAFYRLEMPQCYALFGEIVKFPSRDEDGTEFPETPSLSPRPLPPGIYLDWGEDKEVRIDAYGSELAFVYARELARVNWHGTDESGFGKAVAAFIRNLPEWTPIILYWH